MSKLTWILFWKLWIWQKIYKSPGLVGIINELLKNGGDCLHQSLLAMFQKFTELENTPREWNNNIIVPI